MCSGNCSVVRNHAKSTKESGGNPSYLKLSQVSGRTAYCSAFFSFTEPRLRGCAETAEPRAAGAFGTKDTNNNQNAPSRKGFAVSDAFPGRSLRGVRRLSPLRSLFLRGHPAVHRVPLRSQGTGVKEPALQGLLPEALPKPRAQGAVHPLALAGLAGGGAFPHGPDLGDCKTVVKWSSRKAKKKGDPTIVTKWICFCPFLMRSFLKYCFVLCFVILSPSFLSIDLQTYTGVVSSFLAGWSLVFAKPKGPTSGASRTRCDWRLVDCDGPVLGIHTGS